eukprot:jgi/Psemu1/34003/gm1.34003_g
MVKNSSWVGHKSGVSNYSSKTKLIQLLHTIRDVLPLSPKDWDVIAQIHRDNLPNTDRSVQNLCRKYTNLYRRQIPTGNPNCLEEVQLAKRIKWLIKDKAEFGEEEFDLKEGENNINHTSSDDGYDIGIDISDDNYNSSDNSPLLRQPLQPTQLPPTQLLLCQPSQPTQPTNTTSPTRTQCTSCWRHKCTSSNPRNHHALMSAKRQYRNTKVNSQKILALLRENSELQREQRRENSRLEREHREAVLEAERQQREVTLESLNATIIDAVTYNTNKALKYNILFFAEHVVTTESNSIKNILFEWSQS